MIWENVKGLGTVVLIFLIIRIFLIEAYRIPSGSMIPTLLVGDWLFVNKLAYGPHIPFTDTNLPGYRDPQRGDVVVFESPYQADLAATGEDPTPTLVKRLVAVGGDTVLMRHGQLYVNGRASHRPPSAIDPAVQTPAQGAELPDPAFDWQRRYALEDTPASHHYVVQFGAAPAQPTHDTWGPLVVPRTEFMMLGDNRYDSKDSRYWGFVPRANVRGRPLFIYYSYRADDSDRPLPALTDIRWGRIGTWIQ